MSKVLGHTVSVCSFVYITSVCNLVVTFSVVPLIGYLRQLRRSEHPCCDVRSQVWWPDPSDKWPECSRMEQKQSHGCHQEIRSQEDHFCSKRQVKHCVQCSEWLQTRISKIKRKEFFVLAYCLSCLWFWCLTLKTLYHWKSYHTKVIGLLDFIKRKVPSTKQKTRFRVSVCKLSQQTLHGTTSLSLLSKYLNQQLSFYTFLNGKSSFNQDILNLQSLFGK